MNEPSKKVTAQARGRVIRNAKEVGWSGTVVCRLDLQVGNVSFHLYLPPEHPFSLLAVGQEMTFGADVPAGAKL